MQAERTASPACHSASTLETHQGFAAYGLRAFVEIGMNGPIQVASASPRVHLSERT